MSRSLHASKRITKFTIVLLGVFLVIFLFRFVSINSQPAPPSADLAGDLIVLHTYTQQNPVFPYFKYEAPPLYYFIIVFPFTTIFGNLMGMKIIDSFVPSLLIFPFYFFCKLITKDRLASIIGASLFSFSEAFNEMLGWGGTFNMFAFVFAIASFYYLLRLVREGKTRDSLLLGLFLSLTVGTHNLTAVYVGLATILTFMLSFVPQLRLLPSTRAYLISVLVAGVLSIPYIPYYLYQYQISVHLGINYGQPAQILITSLLYTNARTNQSLYLLLITSIVGLTACALKREVRGALVVIIPTIIANVLLTLLLNPVITNRAAYFLPIPLFASVSAFFSFSIAFFKTPFRLPNLFGFLLIALIISGFVVADANRFESAISYYQIVDSHTLDALNWISSHTLRNDSVYTNFPGLSAWIAGYAERNVLFPSAPGYILTAPDYTLATAANTIDAGNYVLSSQQITIGDFFPSSIENPAVYINSLSGKQGLLFSDDDFNYVNFTDSSGLRSANMVSADFKIFDGFSHNSTLDSLQFNYSWAFAQGVRTVSLAPPNIIKFSLSFFAGTSNNTSLTYRFLAFSGESFEYTSFGKDSGLLRATLSTGGQIVLSVVASSPTGKVQIGSNQDDPITSLPTLTVQTNTQGTNVTLNISMNLQGLVFGPDVAFSYAFATLRAYGVDYLLLDLRAYAQVIRFLHSQVMTSVVFQNSKVVILRIPHS